MPDEPTLTLREAALRIAKISGSRSDKIEDSKLLGLLVAGHLKAGFHCPGPFVSWVPIPASYWKGINSAKFRTIRRSSTDNKLTGTYTVHLGQFANEYVGILSKNLSLEQQQQGAVWATLATILQIASRRYEVVLTEKEWQDYLQSNDLSDLSVTKASKSGRRQLKGWRGLAILIGAVPCPVHQRPEPWTICNFAWPTIAISI
jgi:hypothetical protein